MKIERIETFRTAVPLTKPFKTALRTVTTAESIFVKISCDNGIAGWGEAPPTVVITGDSMLSIESAINHVIKPFLEMKSLLNYELIFQELKTILTGNSSAKAAIDMALYDCLSQYCKLPLYQFLGVECMVGSMIETRIGITAAAHFAASKQNITRFDFDAPLMLAKEIVNGGIQYNSRFITLPDVPGLGIKAINLEGGVSIG